MSLRRIYYWLSPHMRLKARRIFYGLGDIFRSQKYENGLPVPPRSLIYTGSGDFVETGFRFLEYFKNYGLTKKDSVLDIGSGIGRIALPLTHFLEGGDYLGLDIMPLGIEWCNKNITTSYPNFQFLQIDAKNDLYTAQGSDASEVRFPADDQRFDFCCLISVFTHMIPKEVEHYLDEINRVLNVGGLCFATFFVYEDDDELEKNHFQKFYLQDEKHALMDETVISANVAYRHSYLMPMLQSRGFELVEFSRGKWIQSNSKGDFQDFVVLKKK